MEAQMKYIAFHPHNFIKYNLTQQRSVKSYGLHKIMTFQAESMRVLIFRTTSAKGLHKDVIKKINGMAGKRTTANV